LPPLLAFFPGLCADAAPTKDRVRSLPALYNHLFFKPCSSGTMYSFLLPLSLSEAPSKACDNWFLISVVDAANANKLKRTPTTA
jgi:hypothetical protein